MIKARDSAAPITVINSEVLRRQRPPLVICAMRSSARYPSRSTGHAFCGDLGAPTDAIQLHAPSARQTSPLCSTTAYAVTRRPTLTPDAGPVQQGSSPVDLYLHPAQRQHHIEVLQDWRSRAVRFSDAIAGVINIILKSQVTTVRVCRHHRSVLPGRRIHGAGAGGRRNLLRMRTDFCT